MTESEKHVIATKENVEDIINRINSFSEGGTENAESIAVKKAWGKKIPPQKFFYNQIYSNGLTAGKHPLINSNNYDYLIGIKLTNKTDIQKFDELEKQNLRKPNTPYLVSIFLLTISEGDKIYFENNSITVTSQVVHRNKNRKRNLVQQIIFN